MTDCSWLVMSSGRPRGGFGDVYEAGSGLAGRRGLAGDFFDVFAHEVADGVGLRGVVADAGDGEVFFQVVIDVFDVEEGHAFSKAR